MSRVLIAIFLYLLLQGAQGEVLTGRVVGVTDGDTITVLDADHQRHKIRLAGIDAPEHDQPFGQRSKQNLSAVVFGKKVAVSWRKKHRGRLIGKVMVQPPDCSRCGLTLDASQAQLIAGMAWWYRQYAKDQSPQDLGAYEFSEQEAKAKRVGLWSDPDSVPPWEWRNAKRTQ